MNAQVIEVSDFEVKSVQTVSKVEISVLSLELGKCVNILVLLKDSTGKFIKNENICIEGQEYLHWGSDDSYIINLVLQKLGMSKK